MAKTALKSALAYQIDFLTSADVGKIAEWGNEYLYEQGFPEMQFWFNVMACWININTGGRVQDPNDGDAPSLMTGDGGVYAEAKFFVGGRSKEPNPDTGGFLNHWVFLDAAASSASFVGDMTSLWPQYPGLMEGEVNVQSKLSIKSNKRPYRDTLYKCKTKHLDIHINQQHYYDDAQNSFTWGKNQMNDSGPTPAQRAGTMESYYYGIPNQLYKEDVQSGGLRNRVGPDDKNHVLLKLYRDKTFYAQGPAAAAGHSVKFSDLLGISVGDDINTFGYRGADDRGICFFDYTQTAAAAPDPSP